VPVEKGTDVADGRQPASVDQLRLATGFADSERDKIVALFRRLDRRLERFPADEVDMELSVKERDQPSQYVVLECRIAKKDRFVATSRERDIRKALVEVRDDLWRQIDKAVNRRIAQKRR
jgi:ribosome-associated translation inhibitor RaiA